MFANQSEDDLRVQPPLPDSTSTPTSGGPALSVVVPAFNEIHTLETILRRVASVPIEKEIVVVDDGSTDGTRDLLRQLADRGEIPGLRAIFHERNQGKTAALRTGFSEARGRVVLVQDADLEYDPADYPRLVEPILSGIADVVYGSRFVGTPRRVLFFWHTVGNQLLTLLSNMITNLNLTDMETCYKAFRSDIIRRIPIRSSGFGFEAEVTVKLSQLGCRVYEVPISYHGREYWEGKKIGWRDGVQAVWLLLRFAFSPDLGDEALATPTRQSVQRLRGYQRFIWDLVKPWIGRRVLEIGAGAGVVTEHLIDRDLVVATDRRADYRALLERRFSVYRNVRVEDLDLEAPERLDERRFDTILAVNVLGQVEDDEAVLGRLTRLLVPGGRVVLVVPMLPALFGELDRATGRHRRYERAELCTKLERAGFEVETTTPFNAIGIPGWWLNSVWLRRRALPTVQARVNELLVPWLRLETRLRLPVGMSLLAVARRRAGDSAG